MAADGLTSGWHPSLSKSDGLIVLSVMFLWKVRKAGSGKKNLNLFRNPAEPHLTVGQVLTYSFRSRSEATSVEMSSKNRRMSLELLDPTTLLKVAFRAGHSVWRYARVRTMSTRLEDSAATVTASLMSGVLVGKSLFWRQTLYEVECCPLECSRVGARVASTKSASLAA